MTPDEAFNAWLAFVWRPENDGQRKDSAPGETFPTVKGVTADTWMRAVMAGVVPNATALTDATDKQLADVLRWCCWAPVWGDQLVKGGAADVAFVMANMAMVAGPHAAIKPVQALVEVTEDGVMGPITVAAILADVKDYPPALNGLALDLTRDYVDWFATLPKAPEFLNGWTLRAQDAEEAAAKLMEGKNV